MKKLMKNQVWIKSTIFPNSKIIDWDFECFPNPYLYHISGKAKTTDFLLPMIICFLQAKAGNIKIQTYSLRLQLLLPLSEMCTSKIDNRKVL